MSLPFQTPGYEDMELSTQVVIAEALRRGVEVEMLDRRANFIRLKKGERVEYVKEATKTSRDSYVTSLVMENKQVSSRVLEEAGISVPAERAAESLETALEEMNIFDVERVVIKPKTTNFGLGISILKPSDSNLEDALKLALSFGSGILMQEFVEGLECRFLVVDGKCVAVLHRVPANVIGDGEQRIEELVELKNADPRRGKGHKTPLEKIEMGEVEQLVLEGQGFSRDFVPAQGQQVFLRKNSNISTGGDSIDYTDRVHEDYKRLAERAAACVGAKICGVDLILKDPMVPATRENYVVLELNFNPVLYFHDFPYEGENRQVEKAILDLLGF